MTLPFATQAAPVVPLITAEEAEPAAAELLESIRAKHGRVTNMVATLLHSLPSYRAMEFYPVRDKLTEVVGSRAVYFFCYAISVEDECVICSRYHARLLAELDLSFADFEFTEEEKMLIAYGRAMVNNPTTIDPAITDALRARFSPSEIVLITTVGAKMIASNIFNSALSVALDDYLFDVKFDGALLDRAVAG
ncbi:hypothetical protein GIS00_20250 [Nakamurella sp. YIM 132087]|uniref:Carboxymuconolactone decarboxylase family protein n=1 Tax=Nakamurella alba TaxID=2665158 RepID=A0A7K1FQ50_9ACTN|nr:hypothetical protein [Nakamurella alba]MTD16275.1 hypothetical protein [Nakamurella alba]